MDLKSARQKRGWTVYGACQRMPTVGDQTLRNLETGETDGQDVKVRTLLEVIELYWPDVGLDDFIGLKCDLRLCARDKRAERRLKYTV